MSEQSGAKRSGRFETIPGKIEHMSTLAQGISQEKICVVIPMYRAESSIRNVLCDLPDWVWKIVVVDDASPDRSAEAVLNCNDPRLVLVRHTQNQGVGGAVLSGYNRALELGATVLVKMDADDQMDPAHLPRLLAPVLCGKADYAKGNRFVDVENILRMPSGRRMGNLGLSLMTKAASGYWNIFDPTNGYTVLDAEVFRRLDQRRIHKRYFFESSMLVELSIHRAVVQDVDIPARYAGEVSSLSISRVLLEFPWLLLRGFLHRFWMQYFVLDFSLGTLQFVVGALLFLFGCIWGGVFWARSILLGIVATTGTVMISVVGITLGFQLLLQGIAFETQNIPRIPIAPLAGKRARGINDLPSITPDQPGEA
jgi:dolichol-phosphate mannosyltransferase